MCLQFDVIIIHLRGYSISSLASSGVCWLFLHQPLLYPLPAFLRNNGKVRTSHIAIWGAIPYHYWHRQAIVTFIRFRHSILKLRHISTCLRRAISRCSALLVDCGLVHFIHALELSLWRLQVFFKNLINNARIHWLSSMYIKSMTLTTWQPPPSSLLSNSELQSTHFFCLWWNCNSINFVAPHLRFTDTSYGLGLLVL